MIRMKLFCLRHCRPYIVVEITRARENPFSCQRKRFCKTSFPFALQSAPQFAPHECTFVPRWNKERASERASAARPSTHCERSFKPFHRFHGGIPSRAKCATSMECDGSLHICISRNSGTPRVKTISDLDAPFAVHASSDTCLYSRDVFTLIARTTTRRLWESRCDPHDL